MTEPKKNKNKKQKEKPARQHPRRGEKLDEDDIIIEEMYNDCNHEKIKAEQNKKIQQLVQELINQPQASINFDSGRTGTKNRKEFISTKVFNVQTIQGKPYITKIQSSNGNEEIDLRKGGSHNFKQSFNNPVIYEQTTTHTTTTRTVKFNQGMMPPNNYDFVKHIGNGFSDKTEILKHLCKHAIHIIYFKVETGQPAKGFPSGLFDSSDFNLEDLDPKLGELIYSDQQPTNPKEIDRKSKWIVDSYASFAEKSQYKTQLLQLIEYNKIEICENDGYLEQKTEIEITICRLMRQRLMNDELKHEIENYQFQGLQTEQQSLIFSIIKLTKKNIHTLYKKCQNFTMTNQVQNENEKRKINQVFVKDLIQHSKDYVDMARKMGDIYEEMVKKAQFFRSTTAKIFDTVPCFKYIQNESIVKGFFFLFIYKDFVLREILQLMSEILKNKVWQTLAQVERDYYKFMECELVEWVNLMLQCGVFQSYSSIVIPNQNQYQEYKKKSDGTKIIVRSNEGQCYYDLQRRYMKLYLRVYNKICSSTSTRRHHQMASLIDSDYDEDDEEFNSEMEEIFSISPHHSDDYGDKNCEESDDDSDDILENYHIRNSNFQHPIAKNNDQLQNFYNQCNALFKNYNPLDQKIINEGCKRGVTSQNMQISDTQSKQLHDLIQDNYLRDLAPALKAQSKTRQNTAYAFENIEEALLANGIPSEPYDPDNNGDSQGKKKKKRRKNKRKKKKKGEEQSTHSGCTQDPNKEGEQSKNNQNQGDENESQTDGGNEMDDPDFEEDLKQFQLRLSQVSSNDQIFNGGRKLKPNVSNDWLLTIREKSKSLSCSFTQTQQLTLVS